jgi:hypothetical protein
MLRRHGKEGNAMGSAVMDMPKGVCAPFEIGTLGAFFEPSSTSETNTLIRSEERLIGDLVAAVEKQLLAAIDTRSVAELRDVRMAAWPKYLRALRALQDTVSNLVSEETIDRMNDEGIADLALDLQKKGPSQFGPILTEQALFTLWTMGKIRSLSRKIEDAGEAPAGKQAYDAELVSEYRVNSLWAQFHLDALIAAMKFDKPICEDIRESICDGLRASVNAYAVMKDALLLRHPKSDLPPTGGLPWDEEDEQLLAASMRDMDDNSSDS